MTATGRLPSGKPWDVGVKRQWRSYRTAQGHEPVQEFLDALDPGARRALVVNMKKIEKEGTRAGRHLEDDRFELRAAHAGRQYRITFSTEGRKGRVLLALSAFEKKTRTTPAPELQLARQRQIDWRARGREYRR